MKPIPKPKKSKKLTVTKVQDAVNAAIRRRDGRCVTGDMTCCGNMEASHFYAKGGSSGLRFYPPNIHVQCTKHHMDFHNRDQLTYTTWMQRNVEQLEWMSRMRSRPVKYSQAVLKDIYDMATSDELERLTNYIRNLLANGDDYDAE
jgi:hypothetical protein